MDPVTTDTTVTTPAAPKPSVADEFLAAFKAETKPVASAEAAPEAPKPAGAASAEGETPAAPEKKPEEAAESAEAPAKPTSLARRLALVAQAERNAKAKAEADAKAQAEKVARDKEIAPIMEKIEKAKTAKSKMEAAATVLGLDDDGIAELYLELHQHHAEGDKKRAVDSKENIESLVAKLLEQKLTERDAAQKANQEKALNEHREAYTLETIGVLDKRGDEFPLVAIAPPSQVDITAISEAWLSANGEIPEPESVLKLIQDQRQKALDERSARRKGAAPEKKVEATSAPAKPGEKSGSTKASSARNDAALTPPRKMTIAEEFAEAYRQATGSA